MTQQQDASSKETSSSTASASTASRPSEQRNTAESSSSSSILQSQAPGSEHSVPEAPSSLLKKETVEAQIQSQHSRRLVEYFIIVSSKPRVRVRKQSSPPLRSITTSDVVDNNNGEKKLGKVVETDKIADSNNESDIDSKQTRSTESLPTSAIPEMANTNKELQGTSLLVPPPPPKRTSSNLPPFDPITPPILLRKTQINPIANTPTITNCGTDPGATTESSATEKQNTALLESAIPKPNPLFIRRLNSRGIHLPANMNIDVASLGDDKSNNANAADAINEEKTAIAANTKTTVPVYLPPKPTVPVVLPDEDLKMKMNIRHDNEEEEKDDNEAKNLSVQDEGSVPAIDKINIYDIDDNEDGINVTIGESISKEKVTTPTSSNKKEKNSNSGKLSRVMRWKSPRGNGLGFNSPGLKLKRSFWKGKSKDKKSGSHLELSKEDTDKNNQTKELSGNDENRSSSSDEIETNLSSLPKAPLDMRSFQDNHKMVNPADHKIGNSTTPVDGTSVVTAENNNISEKSIDTNDHSALIPPSRISRSARSIESNIIPLSNRESAKVEVATERAPPSPPAATSETLVEEKMIVRTPELLNRRRQQDGETDVGEMRTATATLTPSKIRAIQGLEHGEDDGVTLLTGLVAGTNISGSDTDDRNNTIISSAGTLPPQPPVVENHDECLDLTYNSVLNQNDILRGDGSLLDDAIAKEWLANSHSESQLLSRTTTGKNNEKTWDSVNRGDIEGNIKSITDERKIEPEDSRKNVSCLNSSTRNSHEENIDFHLNEPQNDKAIDSLSEHGQKSPTNLQTSTTSLQTTRSRGASENIRMPNSINQQTDSTPTSSTSNDVSFQPIITDRYPPEDHPDNPLNPMITQFCYPNTDEIGLVSTFKMPSIHHFVLTNDKGKKIYGTCLTVYEEFIIPPSSPANDLTMSREDKEIAEWYRKTHGNSNFNGKVAGKFTATSTSINDDDESGHNQSFEGKYDNIEVTLLTPGRVQVMYLPKVLCLVSSWPYLHAFREYLSQLYRLATMTDMMCAPLERYVLNICKEIPAPPPGSFEIQLKILTSTIRFWAPPANQPIAYVALPFCVLFECLDIDNIIFVWYALTLERKVLLVSSQSSLVTLCAEILCSLLFPMKWSHLYIPMLPRFLSPMLDAPMPYLCGMSRDNFPFAVGDISDETIVVDLDQNVITMGDATHELPPIPLKRRTKLENALEKNAGDVFWNARGVNKEQLNNSDDLNAESNVAALIQRGTRVWREKLQTYDEAFNLAYTPDSPSLLNDNLYSSLKRKSSLGKGNTEDSEQSKWDAVQEAFLRFYVSMLKDYRRFLSVPSESKPSSKRWSNNQTFYTEQFLSSQRSDFQPFLEEFCMTQQFDDFITKRMYSPDEPDVIFFDQSITAKLNRSKMTLKKKDTPFLQSAKAHKVLNKVEAVEPNFDGLLGEETPEHASFNLLDQFYALPPPSEKKKRSFTYSRWPEQFDQNLFGDPRPIPSIIAAEFDRRASLSKRLSANYSDNINENDFEVGSCSPSPEVATFTVFFFIYSAVIGVELSVLQRRQCDTDFKEVERDRAIESNISPEERGTDTWIKEALSTWEVEKNISSDSIIPHSPPMQREKGVIEGNASGFVPDCSLDICTTCDWTATDSSNAKMCVWESQVKVTDNIPINVIDTEPGTEIGNGSPDFSQEKMGINNAFHQHLIDDTEIEEAKVVASAQLDLAFSTLDMLLLRKLRIDPDVYKFLMDACGRCGNTHYATILMQLLQEDGLVVDSEIYSKYLSAFSVSKVINPDDPIELPLAHIPHAYSHNHDNLNRRNQNFDWKYVRRKFSVSPDSSFASRRGRASQSVQTAMLSTSAQTVATESVDNSFELCSSGASSLAGSVPETTSSSRSSIGGSGTETKWKSPSKSYQDQNKDGRKFLSASFHSSKKKKVKLKKREKMITTRQVEKHIQIGESLLDFLYSDLTIDTCSDACPKCSRVLSEDEIMLGWESCSFKDYTTKCVQCKHRFVPRFSVKSTSPSFLGSQGKCTPLYCEFLSPWILRKELYAATKGGNGIHNILDPEWRSGTDINSTLWWNMIVSFKRHKLPITFLLQGSFKNHLIMPMPDI